MTDKKLRIILTMILLESVALAWYMHTHIGGDFTNQLLR